MRMNQKTRCSVVVLLMLSSVAAADTGVGTSDRFTIDNRDGSGFRVTSLTATYGGVFPEGVEIYNTFTACVDWADKTPSKVVFMLNDEFCEVPVTGGRAQKKYHMGKDLEYSRAGLKNDLAVYAVAGDGTQSPALWLYLWGLELPEWAISWETKPDHPGGDPNSPRVGFRIDPLTGRFVFFGQAEVLKGGIEGTVKIPETIPELGGKWGVQINPLDFTWELGVQPRYGDGAGLTGSFKLGGEWGAEAECGTKRKGEISASITGEGEFYPQLRLTDVSAELAGTFTFLLPRAPLLCHWGCCDARYCPYFQLSIAPEVTGTVGMEEGEPSLIAGLKFKNAELNLGVTAAGTIGAGSEGSIYYIAGTIGGKPSIVLQFPPDPETFCGNEYVKQVAFDLIGRAVFESAWWKEEHTWTFNLYTCPQPDDIRIAGEPSGRGQIVVVQREYLDSPEGYCVFPGVGTGSGVRLQSVGRLPEPILNVGNVPVPSIAATKDGGLLLFVYDDASKPTGKHQEVYYARWNGSRWTTHAPLTSNNNPDMFPAAAIAPDGSALAAWVTAPEPSGLETGPRDVLPGFEICFSRYNAASAAWTAPQRITNNDHVDALPWFSPLASGGLRLCWVSSATNAILAWPDEPIVPSMDVMAADWNANGFGNAYAVASDLATVSAPSLVRTTTHELLVYVKDMDRSTATGNDGQVIVRTRTVGQDWQGEQQLTAEPYAYTSAQVAAASGQIAMAVWVKPMVVVPMPDGNDTSVDQLWYSLWDGSSWSQSVPAFEAGGIAGPKLMRNEAGRIILFWTAASSEFSDIYYSVYDADLRRWGPPQQVTHDQGAEKMISLAQSGNDILVSYVKTRVDLTGADGVPALGLSDIHLIAHTPSRDLYLSPTDVSIELGLNMEWLARLCSHWLEPICTESDNWCQDSDLDKSGTVDFNDFAFFGRDVARVAEVRADVHLSGDFAVRDVNVGFYDGVPGPKTRIGSDRIDLLLPGQTKQVRTAWVVPPDHQTHKICVVVDPNNTVPETDDTTNNQACVDAFKPDIEAGTIESVGFPGSETVLIGFTVSNRGDAATGPFDCRVRRNGEAGDIVHSVRVESLEPGGSAIARFAWDVSGRPAGTYTLVLVADVNAVVDEADETNNTAVGQVPVLPDLQAEQWSARVDGAVVRVTIRNIGAKPSPATTVRVISGTNTLGQTSVGPLNPGQSTDLSIPTAPRTPGSSVEIVVNAAPGGFGEVSLLNNTATVLMP